MLAAAGVAAVPAPASAQPQGSIPSGKLGIVVAGSQNVGALSSSYGLGLIWGITAGYQPTSMDRPWSVGVGWSVMWGWFGARDSSSNDSLHTLEMSFGGRFRWLVDDEAPRFFTATAGATVYRTNIPVPPDNSRTYVGPYAGLGAEAYLGGSYLVGFEARYGLLAAGPGSLSLLVSLSWGD